MEVRVPDRVQAGTKKALIEEVNIFDPIDSSVLGRPIFLVDRALPAGPGAAPARQGVAP